MAKKLNSGQILQISAITMDNLAVRVPAILDLLGIEVEDKEYLDKLITAYGEGFYLWLQNYTERALPSTGGEIPSYVMDNEEMRDFIYDLIMNFYISKMLLVELNSPYTNIPEE
jgi:hypothetical protein